MVDTLDAGESTLDAGESTLDVGETTANPLSLIPGTGRQNEDESGRDVLWLKPGLFVPPLYTPHHHLLTRHLFSVP